jgi:DNA-binding CsgD family transcriptional regulator
VGHENNNNPAKGSNAAPGSATDRRTRLLAFMATEAAALRQTLASIVGNAEAERILSHLSGRASKEALPAWEDDDHLKRWLFEVARDLAIDRLNGSRALPPIQPGDVSLSTRRGREVLKLSLRGLSTVQIADLYRIHPATVDAYLAASFDLLKSREDGGDPHGK